MTRLPSINLDTGHILSSSSNESPPWNPHDVSSAAQPTTSQALDSSSHSLSPSPCGEEASQVGDYGDDKHLEHLNRLESLTNGLPVAHTAESIISIGAIFSEASDASDPGIQDTTSAAGETISLRAGRLADLIREKSVTAPRPEPRTFYPINDLLEVVTLTSARQELICSGVSNVDGILDKIFTPETVSGHKTRLFKIFVILTLIEKTAEIQTFIHDGIYDLDLPFEKKLSDGTRKTKNQYLRNHQIPRRAELDDISVFRDWTPIDIENFMEKQHAICVPIFEFNTEPSAPVSHYNLHPQTILPYIENEEHEKRCEGRSDVWKVKLHPAHIICETLDPNMSLAVKQLRPNVGKPFTEESEKFMKEAKNLRRFASRNNDFIIKLLCTFQWRDRYYFLFPWADGNLYEFWRIYPDPLAHLQNPLTARWLSSQCLGLVAALRDIHYGDAHLTSHKKKHGKHGDIKPENILFFKRDSQEDTEAPPACSTHLKISDLGEAEFHSTTSMEVDAWGLRHTPSYCAPELRVKNTSMPNYDIFSLACVLLEFVTWYLRGIKEVESFRDRRLNEPEARVYPVHFPYVLDSFYKHITVAIKDHHGQNPTTGAIHKSSVTREIVSLLEDPYCSDYILDLLVFIKDHLLRMNPEDRANCDTIFKRFEQLDKLCKEDEMYCVKKLKQAPARSRTDTSLIVGVELELSREKRKEILRSLRIESNDQVHITIEERVGIGSVTGHQSHLAGGSQPASTLATYQQTSLSHEPELLDCEYRMQKGDNSCVGKRESCATSRHDIVESRDSMRDESHPEAEMCPINNSMTTSESTPATTHLNVPNRTDGQQSFQTMAESIRGEEKIRKTDDGGSMSIETATGRSRSEKGGKDCGGPRRVKGKTVRFLRRIFCS